MLRSFGRVPTGSRRARCHRSCGSAFGAAVLDVVGTVVAHDVARLLVPTGGLDRDESAATANLTFVVLGLILGYAHADECAGDSAHACANGSAGQGSAERTRGQQRSDAWDRESADADQPAAEATENTSGYESRCRAFANVRVCAGLFGNFAGA